jgi:hypothetical protein
MDQATLVTLGVIAAVLLGVLTVLVLLVLDGRRRIRRELDASREAVAALRARVEAESRRAAAAPDVPSQEFVITDLAEGRSEGPESRAAGVPAVRGESDADISVSAFVSLAVGESLVKTIALGHGLRRALSAENRNRIAFEMRRAVSGSRKQRRRDLKAARRHLRSTHREDEPASGADAA